MLGDAGGKGPALARAISGAGNVIATMVLEVLDGRIQAIRSVVNPDKLAHPGPVGDAWAVARDVKQARRSAP